MCLILCESCASILVYLAFMFLVSIPTSARMSRPSYFWPKWTKFRSPLIVTEFPSTDVMVNLSACSKLKSVEAMTMLSPTFQPLTSASSSRVMVFIL